MFLPSSARYLHHEKTYDNFMPLLTLQNETDLLAYDGVPQRKPAIGNSGLFSYLAGNQSSVESEQQYQRKLEKFFRTKVKQWSVELDDELEKARYNPRLLKKLQEIASGIFDRGKTILFADKLSHLEVYSDKMQNVIDRLEKLLIRTIAAPKLTYPPLQRRTNIVLRNVFQKSPTYFYSIGMPELVPIVSNTKCKSLRRVKSESDLPKKETRTTPFNPENIRKEIAKKNDSLVVQLKVQRVILCDVKRGNGWEDMLFDRLKEVEEVKILCEIGGKIDTLQILAMIHFLMNDSSEKWKLIYLLGSLNYEVFASILHSFSKSELNSINSILKHSPERELHW